MTKVVVDVANSPSFEAKAALEFFTTSTGNLLAAAKPAGVGHQGLRVRGDPRAVVADPNAPYYGARLGERTLLPGADARTLDPRFDDSLVQTAPQQ
jgi:hypothetical protein